MQIEPLLYALFLKDDVWARVYVNDLPLYTEKNDKARSVSEPFNEYLVPGKNTLSFEVLRAPDLSMLAPAQRWTIQFDVYRHVDANDPTKRLSDRPKLESLFVKQFPDMYEEVADKHRRLPFFHKTTFDNPFENHPEPVWRRAPEAEFGEGGTQEQRDAVRHLVNTLQVGSPTGFADAMSLKLAHDRASYDAASHDSEQRKALMEFVDYGPIVSDLDVDALHFGRLHDGRVLHVTRLDGAYVLDVRTKKEPRVRLAMNLLMTQHDGKWRVFA
jgi:hypothetical protein